MRPSRWGGKKKRVRRPERRKRHPRMYHALEKAKSARGPRTFQGIGVQTANEEGKGKIRELRARYEKEKFKTPREENGRPN